MFPNMAYFFIIAVLTFINQLNTLIGDSVICKSARLLKQVGQVDNKMVVVVILACTRFMRIM